MRRVIALPVLLALTSLSACSLVGGEDDQASGADEVVLVTHESFVMSEELVGQFEEESGYRLRLKASGDAGALTNKLVLTKDNPTGDVVFGIDNTFGSRALDEGVLTPYAATLPAGAEDYLLDGDDAAALTPVDTGNVCVNVDSTWFAPEEEECDPAAGHPRGPDQAGVPGPVRHCRRHDQLARSGLPARHDRGVRR